MFSGLVKNELFIENKRLKNIFIDQSSACKLKISLSLDYTLLEFFMREK